LREGGRAVREGGGSEAKCSECFVGIYNQVGVLVFLLSEDGCLISLFVVAVCGWVVAQLVFFFFFFGIAGVSFFFVFFCGRNGLTD